jgi:DnaD/phage-associated family protein
MIKFNNSSIGGVFLMPSQVEKYIKNANTAELRVIMHIFAKGSLTGDEKDIAKQLNITESEVYSALSFWRGAGIISYETTEKARVTIVSDTPADEKNITYTGAELGEAIESNEDIRSLLDFASGKIGKILTPTEQASIFSLVDALGMDIELVIAMIEYFTSGEEKRSVRYIERAAANLFKEGVDTYEKFEYYIAAKEKAKGYEAVVRRVIGAENRAFTPAEKKIVEKFSAAGVCEELITQAYERTINSIGKASLSYMSKIIEKWHLDGIKTAKDLENIKNKEMSKSSLGAFSLDDLVESPKNYDEGDEPFDPLEKL